MRPRSLGTLELPVLLAVARLGDDAYGLAIRRDVSGLTQHDYSVGAIYTTLERLEDKGLVSSRTTDPTPRRGGRARRHFYPTAAGRRALHEAKRLAASAWSGVGTLIAPEPT
jgi:DNA-binding PadR family transcriptional regulator